MIAMASFGGVILGAFLTILTKFHGASTNTGFGAWLAIISGGVGLAWIRGLIKLPDNKPPMNPKS